MTEWRYELTPLTPLHIAAGDTIEPFEYVVHDGRLYKFDPEVFLLALTPAEQDEFVEVAGKNLLKARQLLSARADVIKQIAEYSVPASAIAVAYYEQRLSNPQSDLSIGVFIRTNRRAYIPGSSLKGALRTALLYARAGKPIVERRAELFEAETFEYTRQRRDGSKYPSVVDDPFKYFKISDGNVCEEMTQLAAVNVHTKSKEGWSAGKIPLLREVTWGVLADHTKARAATTVFSVSVNETISRVVRQERRPAWFNDKEIIAACRAFYGKHLEEEAEFHRDDPASYAFYQALEKWEKELPKDACLVRLGWGSGFDAVTVRYAREGARPIDQVRPSRKDKDAIKELEDQVRQELEEKLKKEGRRIEELDKMVKREIPNQLLLHTPASRRLAEGGAPLGWAELRIVPVDDASSIESLEKRLAQVNQIVVAEATPQSEPVVPLPVARSESTAPDTPATDEEIQALIAARGRARREKFAKPKSTAGEKERRRLDEIHRRMREQK